MVMKMTDLIIETATTDDTITFNTLIDKFNAQGASFNGKFLEQDISYVIKDSDRIIAGITGCFIMNAFSTSTSFTLMNIIVGRAWEVSY